MPPLSLGCRIFVSYSHKDKSWRVRLEEMLAPLVRDGLIDPWDDTRIQAGEEWRVAIQEALDSAQIAVLLVSSSFLASEFITKKELPPLLKARKSGLRIIPIMVGSCLYAESELGEFQAINDAERPLEKLKKPQATEELTRIARVIKEAADAAAGTRPSPSGVESEVHSETTPAGAVKTGGPAAAVALAPAPISDADQRDANGGFTAQLVVPPVVQPPKRASWVLPLVAAALVVAGLIAVMYLRSQRDYLNRFGPFTKGFTTADWSCTGACKMISAPEGAFLERLFISGESVIFFTSLRGTEFRDFTARFPVIFNNGDTAMRWLLRMQPVQPVPPVKREQLSGYLFTLKKITGDQGTIFDISGEYLQSANSKPLPLTVAVGKKGVPCPEGIYTVATSAFKDKFTAEIVVELPTHSLQLCADFSFSLPPGTPDMRSGNIALLGDPSTKATVNLFQVEEEKP